LNTGESFTMEPKNKFDKMNFYTEDFTMRKGEGNGLSTKSRKHGFAVSTNSLAMIHNYAVNV
jgi:hypothetical protein